MTLEEVLERGYAKEIYEYAKNNKDGNVDLLTQALLNAKKLPANYASFKDDDYEDEFCVFEDNDLEYYYYSFAHDIKGANVDILCQAIANSKEPYWIYLFARDVKGANIQLLETSLCNNCYYSDSMIYRFARDVKEANIELLQEKMQSAFPEYIYLFARDVEGANIEFLQDCLLSWSEEEYDSDFYEYACKFAQDVEGANIDKMISNINAFIGGCHQDKKAYPSDYYIRTLKLLVKDLENIKKQVEENKITRTLKRK